MRTAQSVPRRSQLRTRWIAGAAAAVLIFLQFRLHVRFPPFSSHPSPSITPTADKVSSDSLFPSDGALGQSGTIDRRNRVRAVIGVQTGFNSPDAEPRYNYALRRVKLRETWFPGDSTELARCVHKSTQHSISHHIVRSTFW